eukprot:12570723-Prorocentrum_lima.AAC.1
MPASGTITQGPLGNNLAAPRGNPVTEAILWSGERPSFAKGTIASPSACLPASRAHAQNATMRWL